MVEELLSSERDTPFPGVMSWVNKKNGFRVIDLEFKADPEKRSEEWILESRRGIPRSQWDREFGSTWTVFEGKPVYADYDESLHVSTGAIVVPRRSKLISGWDGGPNDVSLAWVLGIAEPNESSILIIDEVFRDDGDIFAFVETVESHLKLEWAKLGGFSIHVADPSVFTQSNVVKGGKAMSDIMRQYNMPPVPGPVSFAKRRSIVERMLLTLYKPSTAGTPVPKLRIHERCTYLRTALRGGYGYPKVAGGRGGEYHPQPVKNRYSHIANAMEYACGGMASITMDIPYEGRRLPVAALRF
jgi:hypothetical protein